MKKKTVFVIVMAILIVLFIEATLFSIYKFDVVNPYSACFGMVKILFTNSDYVEVQNFPKKVIFAKPNNSEQLLMEYMKNRGFYNIPDLKLHVVPSLVTSPFAFRHLMNRRNRMFCRRPAPYYRHYCAAWLE